MAETLISVDLTKSPLENENIHNRWHPDIPMACWVNPNNNFILETFDWTGGFIKNNDSADDVRDIDLTTVHYLSGPVGVKGTEPGDVENLTNRAPYPILHLLREASVDRAVAAYAEPEAIIDRNVATVRALGHEGWNKLLSA